MLLIITIGFIPNKILNACLSLGYFANHWKTAQILLFLKPGKDKKSITTYRPSSLLNTLSKLIEEIIYAKQPSAINAKYSTFLIRVQKKIVQLNNY